MESLQQQPSHQTSSLDQDIEIDLLGFNPDSVFELETRQNLEELEILEAEKAPELIKPEKLHLLQSNPSAIHKIIENSGLKTPVTKPNKHLKKALRGHIVTTLKELIKCFNLSSCKENKEFIIAEIKGHTGKLIVNKNLITEGFSEEKSENLSSIDEEESENSSKNPGKDGLSMDWDKINEEHKKENMKEKELKIVNRICELWTENMGGEANSAMIHKWLVVDKGYQGPNPKPDFLVKFYRKTILEFEGKC